MRPVVGIIGNQYLVNDEYPVYMGGSMNCEALVEVCDCMPVIIPTNPDYVSVKELMAQFDGFVFTGGGPMCIEEYGMEETEAVWHL